MGSTRRYITRMLAFIIAVSIGCAVLFPALEKAFMTNPALNGIIVLVALFGMFFCFRTVFALGREIAWLADSELSLKDADIKRLKLLSPLALILKNNRDKGNAVISPTIARSILDSVGMRLDESHDISRYLIGLSTFLGLLGTFWGLMDTVGAVGEVISSLDVSGENALQAFNTIKAGLERPMQGMGTAFSSSLLGLSGALIMGFLDLQTGRAQNNFYKGLDDHLTSLTRYSSSVGSASDDSVTSNAAYTNALLEQAVESLADIRRQYEKEDAKREENAVVNAELLRFIVHIDQSLAQMDRRSDARFETLLREMRDAFKLLVRTISGTESK